MGEPLSESLADRIRADMQDGYDEELELEIEDGESEGADAALGRQHYFKELFPLQAELVRLQDWVVKTGYRLVVLFEGRDAAGKGGVIKRISQRLNPRVCRVAALPAPNDRERTQVLPTLRGPPAGGRGNRLIRSELVQPGRRGTGHGFLYR